MRDDCCATACVLESSFCCGPSAQQRMGACSSKCKSKSARVEQSRAPLRVVLADTGARGAGASERRQAAIRPAGTSGAYHVKSIAVLAHWLMLGHSLAPPPAPHRRAAAYSHALI